MTSYRGAASNVLVASYRIQYRPTVIKQVGRARIEQLGPKSYRVIDPKGRDRSCDSRIQAEATLRLLLQGGGRYVDEVPFLDRKGRPKSKQGMEAVLRFKHRTSRGGTTAKRVGRDLNTL